ncbi:hypothetical protein CCP4SC76_150011 [Gammaproteobacteria bacterium]
MALAVRPYSARISSTQPSPLQKNQPLGNGTLRALAKDLLGIPKIEDLWHGQNAISRGTAGPLAAQVQQATGALAEAREVQAELAKNREVYESQSHGPGRPPNWDAPETHAAQAVQAAEATLAQATERQADMQQAICDLGILLHPVDLATGVLQGADQVEKGLQAIFARMTGIIQQTSLGEKIRAALRKAARLIPAWVAGVARWHVLVEQRLASLKQTPAVTDFLRNTLIPTLYLTRVIDQTRDAERRQELRKIRSQLIQKLSDPAGLWKSLPNPLR